MNLGIIIKTLGTLHIILNFQHDLPQHSNLQIVHIKFLLQIHTTPVPRILLRNNSIRCTVSRNFSERDINMKKKEALDVEERWSAARYSYRARADARAHRTDTAYAYNARACRDALRITSARDQTKLLPDKLARILLRRGIAR